MLVAFEGIDGSGKSTTSRGLAAVLRARGHDILHVDKQVPPAAAMPHPYAGTHLAQLSSLLWRSSRNQPIGVLGELHWIFIVSAYFAALNDAVIEPAERRGQIVVVDNWIYKFVARVHTNGLRSVDEVLALISSLRKPDLVFLLDTQPSVAAARRGTPTRFEQGPLSAQRDFVDYQQTVRTILLDLAERWGWTRISPDGEPVDALARQLADEFESLLTRR